MAYGMAIVKKAAALSLLLVVCTFVTCREDTTKADLWPRPVEPRLSRASQWQPHPARVKIVAAPCPDPLDSDEAALNALVFQPHCTDLVIPYLTHRAEADEDARVDLAAAYLLRGQRQKRPADYLAAFEAADHAVERRTNSLSALFNRALALQYLHLDAAAIEAWDAYLAADSRSDWAGEARQRRVALQQRIAKRGQWERRREEIRLALSRRAENVVADLIADYPSPAMEFFEEVLLPEWAAAPSPARLAELRMFASVLSRRLKGDRYAPEVVPSHDSAALRRGILLYRMARVNRGTFSWNQAEPLYIEASRLLREAGNPLHSAAELGAASARTAGGGDAGAVANALAEQSARRHYQHLHARVQTLRGYILERNSRYPEALAAYGAALETYERLDDAEGRIGARSRRAGVYGTVGQHELRWREVLEAQKDAPLAVSLNATHNLVGAAATAALDLDYPSAALLYQNAFIRVQQERLANTPPEELKVIESLQHHLAIALNTRAVIRLRLQQLKSAEDDLRTAIRLSEKGDPSFLKLLQARMKETEGVRLLERQPPLAIQAFTDALSLVDERQPRTFRAHLLAQRAQARHLSGQDARQDLEAALAELRKEEQGVLDNRTVGQAEELWHAYFGRFRDTYAQLIRYYFEDGQTDKAFQYAERERAYEPLHLILQRKDIPPEWRAIATREPLDIAAIQCEIPTGTFVIQYRVLDDATYMWVLSRDRFVPLTLPVRRETIERWTSELQNAARSRNEPAFLRALDAPYRELIAPALAGIGRPKYLVFIPDGAIHGLPLAALRNPATHRHLIELAPVEVAGSTLLYLFSLLRDRDLARLRPSALLIGNPDFDRSLGFASNLLPAAEREARAIHDLYAPRAEILTGRNATVPAFLDRAGRHSIIHVAAHAVANAREPHRSLLLLAPSANETGALEASKLVAELQLHSTRLVVLSACSSAGGLPVGPQGLAPLVRPLMVAGVPAVIGSLWDVNDATTESLLVSFHRRYVQGKDAATAMREAQLELLTANDRQLRSVLAWAPFQVIGHASSPFGATPNGGKDIGTVHSANLLQRSDGVHPQ